MENAPMRNGFEPETDATRGLPREPFTDLEKRLLNDFQCDFPLSPRPFEVLAQRLGVSELQVLATLGRLQGLGAVSRVGPVLRPNRVGVSTLAAMAVPAERLDLVARLVSAYDEVNHNYERDHHFNLWFVVTAEDDACLRQVLSEIEQRTGQTVLELPLLAEYHIDLGFELKWA
jgi:DNA-binding Lrp family transcriptional regulator